jgi:hypothetical protein
MKKIIGIILGATMIISCGPSKEKFEARQKFMADSIAQYETEVQPDIDSLEQVAKNIEYRRQKGHYIAADFGLVPGIVVNWSPQDDDYIQEQLDAKNQIHIYIHIKQDDGAIKVIECDERTWHNIHTNDILK